MWRCALAPLATLFAFRRARCAAPSPHSRASQAPRALRVQTLRCALRRAPSSLLALWRVSRYLRLHSAATRRACAPVPQQPWCERRWRAHEPRLAQLPVQRVRTPNRARRRATSSLPRRCAAATLPFRGAPPPTLRSADAAPRCARAVRFRAQPSALRRRRARAPTRSAARARGRARFESLARWRAPLPVRAPALLVRYSALGARRARAHIDRPAPAIALRQRATLPLACAHARARSRPSCRAPRLARPRSRSIACAGGRLRTRLVRAPPRARAPLRAPLPQSRLRVPVAYRALARAARRRTARPRGAGA